MKKELRVKVARRYQITIPEEVREEVGVNVGDSVWTLGARVGK